MGTVAYQIVVPLVVAAVLGLARWLHASMREQRATRQAVELIAPHFAPPPPGARDVSVPARLARIEDEQARLDSDLRIHMADEARQRANDRDHLQLSLRRVHDRIDHLTEESPHV